VQAADPGTDDLRRLAEVRLERPLVLSLYLDLDPGEFATPPARATAARSLIDEADRRVRERDGLSHDDKLALKASLQRAREYLERDLAADGARAVAVFAADSAGLFETLKLPRGVRNRVEIGHSPLVGPLATVERREAWCVILVSRQEGRIFRGSPHGLRELGTVHDDVHGRHDQGGWSQARYQRSVEKEAADHLRHAADVLFRHFQRQPFEHLLIGGTAEVVSEFESKLHDYLRERVRGRIDVDVDHSTAEEVLEAARPRFEELQEAREEEALSRLEGRTRAVAGLEDTLAVLNERRVEVLVGSERFGAPGAECPGCGWLGPAGVDACPADGTPAERLADVTDSAIELAIQQSAEILPVVHRTDELERVGGIGALLRF
jgi:peptide chain release factor subunit 1